MGVCSGDSYLTFLDLLYLFYFLTIKKNHNVVCVDVCNVYRYLTIFKLIVFLFYFKYIYNVICMGVFNV